MERELRLIELYREFQISTQLADGLARNHSALKQFLFNMDRLPKNVRTAWYRSIAEKEEASEVGECSSLPPKRSNQPGKKPNFRRYEPKEGSY
jgi:hypothetical protein